MQTRLLLGPSGSGKTSRCVAEVQRALKGAPDGRPLVFLCPKQATFQIERHVLSDPGLRGYARLHVVSFARLAESILSTCGQSRPPLLSEDGRLMVLRALLSRKREELKLFRASARLRGFAQQLSTVLREVQRAGLSPEELLALARQAGEGTALHLKLHDLAAMLQAYLEWLEEHRLQDADRLLALATAALKATDRDSTGLQVAGLWFDGFAALAPQEMAFLTAFLPRCEHATLAFNIAPEALGQVSWLSPWAGVNQTIDDLRRKLAECPTLELAVEWMERDSARTRFAGNPVLQHLEQRWSRPRPYGQGPSTWATAGGKKGSSTNNADGNRPRAVGSSLRLVVCPNPEAEAVLAARELLAFVRAGGQYREAAVIVRDLEAYFDPIRRVFAAFEIPFFLDRREPVGHHPLSELTRSALRTVALSWQTDDWFGALKTGLVHDSDAEIDRLENEALARGWTGSSWLAPLSIPDRSDLEAWLEPLRQKLVEPFVQLATALGPRPNGRQMAAALASFWQALRVEARLQAWAAQPPSQQELRVSGLVHVTFWQQMQEWLENLALAFTPEALPLREWLPIIEAGLATQTVGVIPPTLDQVLVGAIDRSRNPDLKLAQVLGMNESVFPAPPQEPALITSSDREHLLELGVRLSPSARSQLAMERYLGYIACTRPSERLVLSCAQRDTDDNPLNVSPFIDHVRRLFPELELETDPVVRPWTESEHLCEVLHGMLAAEGGPLPPALPGRFQSLPQVANLRRQWEQFQAAVGQPQLQPKLVECLYGSTLETSVSRLEEYAACPFRFAITSGLHTEERRLFQLDVRHQGSFQHEVLARFHQELQRENRRWRDLSAAEARQRIRSIAEQVGTEYEGGLLQASEQSRFTAEALIATLQAFITAAIEWMPQYQFDPHSVELAFGIEEKPLPAWEIDLGEGHRLSFRGKIDRVDLVRQPGRPEALCVVIDYKSSARRLDPVLVAHGVQLQLLAYLNVLRSLEAPERVFGVQRLVPAGVFFVNLRGRHRGANSRTEVLEGFKKARALAYQHTGRFDAKALPHLDNRSGVSAGDQFNYRLCASGKIHGACREPLDSADFLAALDGVETHLRRMGQEIYAGTVRVDPYRKGQVAACDQCEYQGICRIDPWTHTFRVLREA